MPDIDKIPSALRGGDLRSSVARRTFLRGAMGLGAAGLLAACSSNSTSSGGGTGASTTSGGTATAGATTATTGGATTASAGGAGGGTAIADLPAAQLNFWGWTTDIAKVVDIWNKKYPHIQVKVSTEAQGDALTTKVLTANTAGNPPDVIQVEYQNLPVYVTNSVVQDLSSVSGLQSQFASGAMNLVTFGGKVYGIPQDVGPMMLFYRKDLFDQYGLTVPTTWDDFASVAKEVRAKAPKAYLTTFSSGDPGWFAGLAEQAGANWWSNSNGAWNVGINDAPTQKLAEYWGNLVNTGVIQGQPMYTPQWNAALANGTLLAWPSAVWGAGVLQGVAGATSGKWEMTALPQWSAGDNKNGYWGGSATSVAAKSKNQAQAIAFSTWLNTDPDALAGLISISGIYPAATAGQSSPALAKAPAFMPNQPDYFKTAATLAKDAVGFEWGPNVNVTYSSYTDAFAAAIQKKADFKTALDKMQSDSIADLKKQGFQVAGS